MSSEQVVRTEKREVSWTFVLVFLLGTAIGAMMIDPISNLIFYWRNSTQVPLTPVEQVFFLDFLPAIVYAALFFLAIFIMNSGKVSPKAFRFILIGFASLSVVFSLLILGLDPAVILMLIVSTAIFVFSMYYTVRVKMKKGYIEV